MVYGCDPGWWRHRRGLPEFHGLKVAWSGAPLDYPDIRRVDIAKAGAEFVDRMAFERVGCVGGGGNSGFQAFNLAVQLGAKRVLLVGFDMNSRAGAIHWYGRNTWASANNPDEHNYRRWRQALDGAAGQLAARGVEVINASPDSTLTAYPKATIAQALAIWGLAPNRPLENEMTRYVLPGLPA